MSHSLHLVVVHTPNLDQVKWFYEKLGLHFLQEGHNGGQTYYSALFANKIRFEIRPGEKSRGGIGFETNRFHDLSLKVIEEHLSPTFDIWHGHRRIVLRDPDSRRVEIVEINQADS